MGRYARVRVADGTGLCGQQAGGGGGAFVVAGGAPVWISSFNNISPNPCVPVDEYAIDHAGGGGILNHLSNTPADGTFLSGQPGGSFYRVAGGAPLAVTDCGALGGCLSPVVRAGPRPVGRPQGLPIARHTGDHRRPGRE